MAALELVSVVKEIDFTKVSVDETLKSLNATREGLSQADVDSRLAAFGPNALPEKKRSKLLMFLSYMNNPLSWVMESAAVIAIGITYPANPKNPPDYPDFVGIVLLLLINATIGYIEDSSAADAVAALKAALAPTAKALRNGKFDVVDAKTLVPGDVISIKLGDVIPADGKLLEGEELKIDQAALTGESLPVTKRTGDVVFSGSTVKQGEIEVVVTGTGVNTFFGKAAALVDSTENSGHFQALMNVVGGFCMAVILSFLIVVIIVQYAYMKYKYREGVDNILTILIGGVPIAMPVVLSVTLAVGAGELAKKKAIVTRMTAIEELAGMNMLCSDKTGTLTLNRLTINKDEMLLYSDTVDVETSMLYAARASRVNNPDAIDGCIVRALGDDGPTLARKDIEEKHFQPFDPVGKKTAITYKDLKTGKFMRIAKGYPPVIVKLANKGAAFEEKVDSDLDAIAKRGFRGLGLAIAEVDCPTDYTGPINFESPPSKPWTFLSIMPLFDPPRHDTAITIQRALNQGVPVKMITGDALAIGKETGRMLGMGQNMYPTSYIFNKQGMMEKTTDGRDVAEIVKDADGFAGVYPEHKYEIVQKLKELGFIVGMTGDGVNDAPALKAANIGIAVADATDAARGAADIVLTEEGLSVIIDAIICSRRIFQRMLNYLTYAVAITVAVVVRFAVAVWAFKFNMPPFMLLVIVFLNDGTIMSISTDRVDPSPLPDKWNMLYIFVQGTAYGCWMALSSLVLIGTIRHTDFWVNHFPRLHKVEHMRYQGNVYDTSKKHGGHNSYSQGVNDYVMHSIIYLQVSIIGQALIFITRSRYFFFLNRPSTLLAIAFCIAQIVATFIAVYADWGFTKISGCGWGWALVIWVWNGIWFIPMDLIKIVVRCSFEGDWSYMFWPPKSQLIIKETVDPNSGKMEIIYKTGDAGAAKLRGDLARLGDDVPVEVKGEVGFEIETAKKSQVMAGKSGKGLVRPSVTVTKIHGGTRVSIDLTQIQQQGVTLGPNEMASIGMGGNRTARKSAIMNERASQINERASQITSHVDVKVEAEPSADK